MRRQTTKRRLMEHRKSLALALALFLAITVAGSSFGCPVCFGESDAPIVKGMEMSVLFMVGVTYSLILGGIGAFLLFRRRAQQHQDLRQIG